MRLLPKEETFWQFLTKGAANFSLASDLLFQGASKGHSSLAGASVRIKAMERESAQTLHDLQIRLHKTFVTPIDPEDISLLFEGLDYLLDNLEGISYRMTAYHLEPTPSLMVELGSRIHASAELLEKAFGLLSITESTEELCKQVLSMEEGTDQAVREGITGLFQNERDPIVLLKQKEIYDLFERLSHSIQNLANALQNVSIKNS